MLTLHTKVDAAPAIAGELVLPWRLREKSRLRATLTSGEEVAVLTQRGTVLRDGELLKGSDGRVIRIVGEFEPVYRVECEDTHALLRCAFHLGNRHTQTQVGHRWLRIAADPVLREMLAGLGASVSDEYAVFEPEAGAYGGGHRHGDDGHPTHLLAPLPVRQKIHRPSDPA
jgi:urease accessory protein